MPVELDCFEQYGDLIIGGSWSFMDLIEEYRDGRMTRHAFLDKFDVMIGKSNVDHTVDHTTKAISCNELAFLLNCEG